MPKVIMGRVQRRTPSEPLELRPFNEDVARLVERGRFVVTAAGNTWVASDLTYDVSGTFATGLMGFSSKEVIFRPDEEDFSWQKADIQELYGGTRETITPFALDTRDDRRWIGFVSARRVKPRTFETAFSALLQAAVADLQLIPAEWGVDPIPRPETLREWIEEHPDVAELERVVKFTNPSRRFDEDREAMRELGAVEKDERWKPGQRAALNYNSDLFREFEDEAAEGYVDLTLHSRSGGGGRVRFSTKQQKAIETYNIPTYGADLARGISLVLEQVNRFSRQRAGEGQLTIDDDSA